jgi:CheY-like chemotaxis protein
LEIIVTDALTVLVVDDDAADAERVSSALRAAGHTVLVASDPVEAIAQHGFKRLDLVVSDVSMPDFDGPTMLRSLRADGSTAIFIAMTNDPSSEVRRRCASAGAVVCLPKTADISILVAMVEQIFSGAPGSDVIEDPVDAELMARMRLTFLAQLPERCAAVRDALELKDVAAAAHKMAGASAQFGFPGLAALCRSLEQEASTGSRSPELIEAVLAAAAHAQAVGR